MFSYPAGCESFRRYLQKFINRLQIFFAMKYTLEKICEYSPHGTDTTSLSLLKEFATVPFFIPWYHSQESRKVFPIIMNEISDINPSHKAFSKIIDRNPFFDHTEIAYFVAKSEGKPIGRVAAFIDSNYNTEHEENSGWLGMFECVEDKDIAEHLLASAWEWLSSKGCKKVIGPAKYNANGEVGLLIDGFEHSPYFMEPYNAPYYQEYFTSFGFTKLDDWFSHIFDHTDEKIYAYVDRIKKLEARILDKTEVEIRNGEFKKIDKEIEIIKSLYNSEWGKGNHPQFVKMTDPEFASLAKGIKTIALEDFVFIAEKNGVPIGVSVTVPNINEVISHYDSLHPGYIPSKNPLSFTDIRRDLSIFSEIQKKRREKDFSSVRILIIGVKEGYRKTGIDALLYYRTFQSGINLGVKAGSGSETAERNLDIVRPLDNMGRRAFHWRVYELSL